MPRTARCAPGGMLVHVLNRGNARAQIFDAGEDYHAFQRVLTETRSHVPMRVLACCRMPNHWHCVLWPREDGHLGEFMRRVATTHVRRWHLHRQSVGAGHLHQGTYKSFPIQKDEHLLTVCRYVERNPLRAKLVEKAEDWPWSSLWQRLHPAEGKGRPSLCEWPVRQPADWVEWVSRPETPAELEAMRASVTRGRPYGTARLAAARGSHAGVGIRLPASGPAAEEMIETHAMAIGLIPFSCSCCGRGGFPSDPRWDCREMIGTSRCGSADWRQPA